MKRVIGVDYSPNGTAWWTDDDEFSFSSMLKKRYTDDERHIQIPDSLQTLGKVYFIAGEFSKLIKEKEIKILSLESPAFFGTNQKEDYKSGYHIFRYIMYLNGGMTINITPNSLKLYSTGNGRAEKIDVIKAAQDEIGNSLDINSFGKQAENIADSFWLRKFAIDIVTNKCYNEDKKNQHKHRALLTLRGVK